MLKSQIVSVATKLGANERKIDDIGAQVQRDSTGKNIPVHYIEKLTGVKHVFHRNPGENTSDLAVAAAKLALERAELKIGDIDLLIFASASQDLIEPATSHIVSAQLGASNLAVFDVKNACNSFMNGMQVANGLIRTASYRRVLVVSGETPSMAIRWNNRDREQFLESFAGFSMSDGGAAMVLAATEDDRGIIDMRFTADSSHWNVGTLAMGGSRAPRDIEATYFNMDGKSLAEAFLALGPDILNQTLEANQRQWSDFAAIGMHQVSAPYMARICRILGVPRTQIVETIQSTGNITSLSLPYQLELSLNEKRVKEGDEFAFIGFAGGISTGLALMKL